ncbi:hypothetical protein C3747_62g172 [Trypanosoma cruzi]|uniref:RING-type domain-containing protein n=2 Tax=Trypanosoma cruzi TaxID=5693 RepID=Q4DKZ7_TRYCC|nr:hypothetical protein, conserved [Trypanosoma cruzi]EAN93200.1 hypothetical protein, conserved [Trypanosoma cruzi]PWV11164.1 hypothetical protein C3747_62g172 [Trypanosoma cruzi]|eukprot:XP_815051.1 hypothetical protein [Trypanosoma cruzi strain CL Brener]
MSTCRGLYDPFIDPIRGIESIENSGAMELTQCSLSQLPDLVGATEQLESDELNTHVVSTVRELLCCPICHRPLVHDPAVVDTCGHAFCYDCINLGIENGCVPVASTVQVEDKEDEGRKEKNELSVVSEKDHHTCLSRHGRKQPRRRTRQRRRKFTCPVCLGPAHKWNLVRVRFIQDVVTEFLSHAALAEAFSTAEGENDVPSEVRTETICGDKKTPRRKEKIAKKHVEL